MFSAWVYGLDINNSILRLSYAQELVLGFSRAIQDFIRNPRYREIFPQFQSYGDKPFEKEKESDWILKGGNLQTSHIARTREGSTTGLRARTAIILDDMIKGSEEATNSEEHRKNYARWNNEWKNRRVDTKIKYILVGTMWSTEDILNKVMNDIQALHETKPSKIKGFEKYVEETTDGYAVFIKVPLLDENDNSTCLQVMTTEEARILRDTDDPFSFSCVYQQDPIAPTGLEFADENLQHFEELPRDENGNELCADYAFSVLDPARRGKDNVAMPIFKYYDNKYYFIDCIFKKKAMTDLYDEIVDKIIQHNIIKFVIENNIDTSLKTVLEDRLHEKGYYVCEIIEKYNTVKKEERIKNARGVALKSIVFKDKRLYKPNTDYGRFMKNLTTYSFDYPNKYDDACFEENTLIATNKGYKAIKDIKVGDKVLTPIGFRKVINCGITGKKEVINKFNLKVTKNHKVWNSDKFTPIEDVNSAENLSRLSIKELIEWKYKMLLCSTEKNIEKWERENITYAHRKTIKKEKVLKDFMWRFGNFITNKKYLKATTFIIKMVILLITTLTTWSVFQLGNIYHNMAEKICKIKRKSNKQKKTWRKQEKKLKSGTKVKKEKSGIKNIMQSVWQKAMNLKKKENVSSVIKNILPKKQIKNTVQTVANKKPAICVDQKDVKYAEKPFIQQDILHIRVQKSAEQRKEKEAKKINVYNLTIEEAGCYYANDILVSNCDAIAMMTTEIILDKARLAKPKPIVRSVLGI